MRIAILSLPFGAALLAPGAALAQGAAGHPMLDVGQVLRQAEQPLTQWHAPPSLLTQLSRDSQRWISEETDRQAQGQRKPVELLVAVDRALGEDVRRLSRRLRMDGTDILTAVVLKIVIEAERDVAVEARRAGTPEAAARLVTAEAHRKEVVGWASENSLLMAAM